MIHPTVTVKVSEQVNRKWPPRNTILQLSVPYTGPKMSNLPPPEFLSLTKDCGAYRPFS